MLTVLKHLNSFVYCVRSLSPVFSPRSSDSIDGHGSGSSSSSSASLLNQRRELISSQFRASQDERDNNIHQHERDPPPPGMDSMQAAASSLSTGGMMEEEDHLIPNPQYISASSNNYASSPSKLRLSRYSQTGYYNPYPSYVAAFPNVPPTYYPQYSNSYPSYREKQLFDPIYDGMQTRSMQSHVAPLLSSTNSRNRDGFYYGEPGGGVGGGPGGGGVGFSGGDNEAAAGEHGGGGGGHGGGGGKGWGWGGPGWSHYTSKVNTNGIGLLGLLGLLSLLSNVLLQFTTTTTTTTTAAARLKRRDIKYQEEEEEDHERRRERIFMEILPHLTPVAFAPDGTLPLECTFHGICMTNKILVNELGFHGRAAGARISGAVVKLLDKDELGSKGKSKFRKKLEHAALYGRDGKDCEKKYPLCKALEKETVPNLPFVIRMKELPELISKISKLA
ncbi:unnamed protein product [Orchesella dallaii]|uniref:Uncharacterized protein n=1 Tax=Orchesella dallaii TaxID=48710 RepID=A0ABP1RH32_9HEXA